MLDSPLQRIRVPLDGLAVHEALREAEEEAAALYGRVRHRRLGFMYDDRSLTAWFGEVVA